MKHPTTFLQKRWRHAWLPLSVLAGLAGNALAQTSQPRAPIDVTFIFGADFHVCWNGYQDGDTNPEYCWNQEPPKNLTNQRLFINDTNSLSTSPGKWSGAAFIRSSDSSGQSVYFQDGLCKGSGCAATAPTALVMGGDLTDDGGGCLDVNVTNGVVWAGDPGSQLAAVSCFFDGDNNGVCEDTTNTPVVSVYPSYLGLGNHDLDPGAGNHEPGSNGSSDCRDSMYNYLNYHLITSPLRPSVTNYDPASGNYSWDWGGVHGLQLNLYLGNTQQSHTSGQSWIENDLRTYAGDGRPVLIFQHYGFAGSANEEFTASDVINFVNTITNYNVVGIFSGHEHPQQLPQHAPNGLVSPADSDKSDADIAATNLVDDGYDAFLPGAAYYDCYAVAHLTDRALDVKYSNCNGSISGNEVDFTKPLVPPPTTLSTQQIDAAVTSTAFFVYSGKQYALAVGANGVYNIYAVNGNNVASGSSLSHGSWGPYGWTVTSMAQNGNAELVAYSSITGKINAYRINPRSSDPSLVQAWTSSASTTTTNTVLNIMEQPYLLSYDPGTGHATLMSFSVYGVLSPLWTQPWAPGGVKAIATVLPAPPHSPNAIPVLIAAAGVFRLGQTYFQTLDPRHGMAITSTYTENWASEMIDLSQVSLSALQLEGKAYILVVNRGTGVSLMRRVHDDGRGTDITWRGLLTFISANQQVSALSQNNASNSPCWALPNTACDAKALLLSYDAATGTAWVRQFTRVVSSNQAQQNMAALTLNPKLRNQASAAHGGQE